MKKIRTIACLLLTLFTVQRTIACTPLAVPTINNYTVVGNNLILNSTLNNVWTCNGYFIQVELTCNSKNFTGVAPFFHQSAQVNKTSTPFAMPTQTIPLGPLCAGTVYKFRIREGYGPFNQFSAWSAAVTFTTPGNFVQPIITVNPNPVNLCPPQTQQLTTTLTNTCGGGNITYAWSPAAGLSCVNCPNPVASPAASTVYTVTATGGVTGCWSTSSTVAVNVITVAPIVGTVSAPSSVCFGSTATVAISTFSGNLQWYSSSTSSGPWTAVAGANSLTLVTPTLSANTCYQASVTGCPNTLTSNTVCITVNPNPTVTVTNGMICQGFTSTLTAGGASTYTWSAGAGPISANSATVAPPANSSFTVVGSALGCTAQAVANVTVNPTPTLSVLGSSLCVAETISLTANSVPGATFAWSGPQSFASTLQNPTIINGQANMTGIYTVVVTSTAGCVNSGTAHVQVTPLPTVSVLGTNTLCSQNFNNSVNTTTLNANGAANYTWTLPPGFSSPNLNNNSIVITAPITPTTVVASMSVFGVSGTCTNSTTYALTVYANPTISVLSSSMCAGTSATMSASGATNYSWSPSTNLNSTTGSMVAGNPTTTTLYNVVGESLGCFSSTETGSIQVVQNPTVTISPFVPPICAGTTTVLTANGATNYTWTLGSAQNTSNANNITITPSITTVYSLIGEANTCTGTAVQIVTVIPLPTLQALAERTAICQGEQTQINANGASTYSWSPNIGISSQFSNFVTANPTVSIVYTLIGNNGICTSSLSVPITVIPAPKLELAVSPNRVCEGNSSSIFASGAQSYIFTPTISINSIIGGFASVTPSVATNYTVIGVNSSGTVNCAMTKEILVEVIPTIVPSISSSVAICKGDFTKLSSGGRNTYLWLPNEGLDDNKTQNPIANPSVTTVYTVSVSDHGFCSQTATVLVRVNPTPTVNAGINTIFNSDEPMYIEAKGTGTLTWIEGDAILCAVCPSTQIMPSASSCYKVKAINEFGCKAFDDVCIEVTNEFNIYIPNIFTPNYDGINDVFKVHGTGITEMKLTIFNRWGEELYTTTDPDKGWDGFYNGVLSKNDVYAYLVNFTSLGGKKHTRTGHVTLMK